MLTPGQLQISNCKFCTNIRASNLPSLSKARDHYRPITMCRWTSQRQLNPSNGLRGMHEYDRRQTDRRRYRKMCRNRRNGLERCRLMPTPAASDTTHFTCCPAFSGLWGPFLGALFGRTAVTCLNHFYIVTIRFSCKPHVMKSVGTNGFLKNVCTNEG